MLKQRGVEDVSHLSGGIHRYVEKYGSDGFWKGKMFVFDQRVALDPDSMVSKNSNDGGGTKQQEDGTQEEKRCEDENIVGKCIECQTPYDRISGATLCAVCRDLILLCPSCKSSLSEFHCERHQLWKKVYFTFLERFTLEELHTQHKELQKLHDTVYAPKEHRNVRRTLRKQMDKVLSRINDLEEGRAVVDGNAKRRCRTCFELEDICDGLCWGFWKQSPYQIKTDDNRIKVEPILAVRVGDRVTPGPNWNELRLGRRYYSAQESRKKLKISDDDDRQQSHHTPSFNGRDVKVGTVVEIKSSASGGNDMDCVAVSWDVPKDVANCRSKQRTGKKGNSGDDVAIRQSEVYRWGTIARNGQRMYDVKLIPSG